MVMVSDVLYRKTWSSGVARHQIGTPGGAKDVLREAQIF